MNEPFATNESMMYAIEHDISRYEIGRIDLPVKFVSCDAEKREMTLSQEVLPIMMNDHGTVHGGFIAWLLDTTMGVLLKSYSGDITSPTIDMHINYLKPVLAGNTMYCTARIVRLGNTLANTESEISVNGVLCATATANLFRIKSDKSTDRR